MVEKAILNIYKTRYKLTIGVFERLSQKTNFEVNETNYHRFKYLTFITWQNLQQHEAVNDRKIIAVDPHLLCLCIDQLPYLYDGDI